MISSKMESALNKQMNNEFFSAYLYFSMAAASVGMGFKGIANWFTVQAKEETAHGMKFYKYLLDHSARVTLAAIPAPPDGYASVLAMFESALAHEQKVTKGIRDLADLAASEKDYATSIQLQWFITEQVEEEANATEIIQKMKMIEGSKGGLFMIDHELGKRTFSA